MKDKCVFVKTEGEKRAIGSHCDTRGYELGIIGMHVKMDRKNKRAILSQPKWEQLTSIISFCAAFGLEKKSSLQGTVPFGHSKTCSVAFDFKTRVGLWD